MPCAPATTTAFDPLIFMFQCVKNHRHCSVCPHINQNDSRVSTRNFNLCGVTLIILRTIEDKMPLSGVLFNPVATFLMQICVNNHYLVDPNWQPGRIIYSSFHDNKDC